MRISRFYYPDTLAQQSTIQLIDNAAHHVSSVLRLKINDSIILFNGDGADYSAKIINIAKKTVNVQIIEKLMINRESSLQIHLGQAISRSEKIDLVIQKAVELGVTEITPLMMQHCAVKFNAEQLNKKMAHWQGIIINACEQCGRNVIPTLYLPISIATWLEQSHSCGLVFDTEEKQSLKSFSFQPAHVSLLIGPEGGLSNNELTLAKHFHFNAIRLGHRILRTETAAIAAISIVQYQWGDY
jgi:16S rRNA (uracil1498-N3)-methyltransferase